MNSEHWLVTYSKKVNADLAADSVVHFLDDPEDNAVLNDLENYPHAFVLACCMDRQINAERAWHIPCFIKSKCNEFTIEELSYFSLRWYKDEFNKHTLHRHNNMMAEIFYAAVVRIKDVYGGDASRIWSGMPSSAAVVSRFLEFDGVGVKIATMATNILHRQYKIPFSDCYSIDVSPDVHVKRIFQRIGLIKPGASNDEVIYKARELCPEYPGVVDEACWNIGRDYCHPKNPDCKHCPVSLNCPSSIIFRSDI